MNIAYPAIIHQEDTACWVEFPDLDGCFSDGGNIADALANAVDALGGYVCTLMDNNATIPKPSAMQDVHPEDGFVSMIVSDPLKYKKNTKSVKKTLTIPEWLNDEA